VASAAGYFHPQIYRIRYKAYSVKMIAYDRSSAADAFAKWIRSAHGEVTVTKDEILGKAFIKNTHTVTANDTTIVAMPKFD
jgi:hypothetical protein